MVPHLPSKLLLFFCLIVYGHIRSIHSLFQVLASASWVAKANFLVDFLTYTTTCHIFGNLLPHVFPLEMLASGLFYPIDAWMTDVQMVPVYYLVLCQCWDTNYSMVENHVYRPSSPVKRERLQYAK